MPLFFNVFVLVIGAQAWQCTSGKELSWNLLTLFTTSGLLFLEVSLVAFLLQGNYTTGLESLTQTLVISGVIVAADIIIKVSLANIWMYDLFQKFCKFALT